MSEFSSHDRPAQGLSANLDLLQALRRAQESGDADLERAIREDLYQMIDAGNATTYFELAIGEFELAEDHPDFQSIQQIAEWCAIKGMEHARIESSNREREARAYVPTELELELLRHRYGDDTPSLTKEEVGVFVQTYIFAYGEALASSDKGSLAERDRVLKRLLNEQQVESTKRSGKGE